ncbi:MAG: 50S ribosomal protein L19e [Candidatus Micrarchaeota archaeon]|nr:50S ribosomal protein L19e [Candidatus Micrarchaeota archaeon]
MAMNTVRRIASDILKTGESNIKFKPDSISKVGEALTREDVRSLIAEGAIIAKPKRGVSRVRGRAKQKQKAKGRRFGKGSRRGTSSARKGDKETWMQKIRAQRKFLRQLLEEKRLEDKSARKIYMMVKGNAFKGVKMLEVYLRDNKYITGEKLEAKKSK